MKSSTEALTVVALGLGCALTACPAPSATVEAPMTPSDGGPTIAFVAEAAPEPDRRAFEMPFARGDTWRGSYYCTQGRTSLFLSVEEASEDTIDVLFAFDFHGNPRFSAAKGSFLMRGSWDAKTRRLDLKADRWVDQPDGWEMVDLAGTMTKTGGMVGTVGGVGCTTFSVVPDTPKNVR